MTSPLPTKIQVFTHQKDLVQRLNIITNDNSERIYHGSMKLPPLYTCSHCQRQLQLLKATIKTSGKEENSWVFPKDVQVAMDKAYPVNPLGPLEVYDGTCYDCDDTTTTSSSSSNGQEDTKDNKNIHCYFRVVVYLDEVSNMRYIPKPEAAVELVVGQK